MIVFTEIGWWIMGKLIILATVLAILWGVMSWYDVASDNLIKSNPTSEGNMFAKIIEVADWFN